MNIKKLVLTAALFTSALIQAQYTDIINSNRPGKSISAFSVRKTVIQAEGGVYGIQEKHDLLRYEANGFGTDLNLRYGAFLSNWNLIWIRNINMIGIKRL